jgi:hypothetical protein
MVSINYWWHRENNTILIINDWINWTILDDMKVLLELGMSLKKTGQNKQCKKLVTKQFLRFSSTIKTDPISHA